MSTTAQIGLTGTGVSLPANIRTNDDPIFDWLKAHPTPGQDLFKGYKERRVLAPGEKIVDHMVAAAQAAIDAAGIAPAEVDILFGTSSVSEYVTPNELAVVHNKLGLPATTWIMPLNDEFTTFNSAVLLAQGWLQTGRGRNALIACGCNWTRYVSYQTPQSISASDGAAAAVVGAARPGQWALVDAEVEVESAGYGVMFMQGDRVRRSRRQKRMRRPPAYTKPYFHITPDGQSAYLQFGAVEPSKLAARVLARNGLAGPDIALISHQSSSVLIEKWQEAIQPAQYVQSLESFANMTLATIPVNLASFSDQIKPEYLLLLGIGVQLQTSALLFKRIA